MEFDSQNVKGPDEPERAGAHFLFEMYCKPSEARVTVHF